MARLLGVVNSESEQLKETPTIIYYTPEWPYGRYTHPAGGRFIRPYGQTSPLPETLTELQMAETESPPAREYLNGAWIPKSQELSPHDWGATTRPMSAEEQEYLAAWGRPRFGARLADDAVPPTPTQPSWLERHKEPLIVAGVLVGIAILVTR